MLYDRMNGRFFEAVRAMEEQEFSGFALLALDCLLIESLQQFKEGVDTTPRGQGGRYFERFLTGTEFKKYFDAVTAAVFYDEFRCGILHQAEIKNNSRVWSIGPLLRKTPDGQGLVINRKKFHSTLRTVFADYLRTLRRGEDKTLRENFKRKMDLICR